MASLADGAAEKLGAEEDSTEEVSTEELGIRDSASRALEETSTDGALTLADCGSILW